MLTGEHFIERLGVPSSPPALSLFSFSVRSCSWNASLVVDGQFHYNFPWGEHLMCTLHAEDMLRTVNIQPSHKHII